MIWQVFSVQILPKRRLAPNLTIRNYSLNDNIYSTPCNGLTKNLVSIFYMYFNFKTVIFHLFLVTSVPQKNVPSAVVIYYGAWYVFLRDRRYWVLVLINCAYVIKYEIYIQLNIKTVSSSLSKKSAQHRNSRKKEKKVDVWWTSCVSAHCKPDGRVSIFGVGHHFCANTWQPYPYIPGQKAMGGHSCQFLLYILIKKPNPSASVWNISYPGL